MFLRQKCSYVTIYSSCNLVTFYKSTVHYFLQLISMRLVYINIDPIINKQNLKNTKYILLKDKSMNHNEHHSMQIVNNLL